MLQVVRYSTHRHIDRNKAPVHPTCASSGQKIHYVALRVVNLTGLSGHTYSIKGLVPTSTQVFPKKGTMQIYERYFFGYTLRGRSILIFAMECLRNLRKHLERRGTGGHSITTVTAMSLHCCLSLFSSALVSLFCLLGPSQLPYTKLI